MNNYAPILIPTLNRFEHFKRCVESLSQCTHADKTDLYIALDYPLKESHWEGYEKIEQYLTAISNFKKVIIFKRDHNFGAMENYKIAMKEIFKSYDKLIFTEDDNIFSKNFLEYINKGLNKYKHHKDIFSICGYNYPVEMPVSYKENIYMWKGYSAWGCGIWREKFNEVVFSLEEIECFLRYPKNTLDLEKYAGHMLPGLLRIIETKHITDDTVICMHLIKNNMYSIFPVVSKVRNYGHDGSGVHGGISNVYKNQMIDENEHFEYMDCLIETEDKEILKVLKKHFDSSYKAKIKMIIKYLLFLLKIKTK